MSVDIVVPPLGESVVEATVLNWLKREGDRVTEGDAVVELETDKVNMEVYAPTTGVVGSITRQAGVTVGIGESLGTVNENDTGPTTSATAAAGNGESQPAATAATPVAQKMAEAQRLDISRIKGTGPGGKVTKEDVANYAGAPPQPPPRKGEIFEAQAQSFVTSGAGPASSTPTNRDDEGATAPAPALSPLLAKVGVGGGQPGAVTLTLSEQRREERVPITRLRETIMRRLKEAQNTAAMLTTFNEVDMSAVMEVRKRRKDTFKEKHGVNLGFMSFFTKAVIGALKAFPNLNAEILEQEKTILLKHYYDIGVAVSTERGLVVPVLRDADGKSFAEIEKGVVDLATRARDNKLTLPDLAGGTFTITNGGIFGSLMSTPILNVPQVGILGMHKIQERPVALNGEIAIRPMMFLALSYDHRIVDGSEAVRFLVRVKELIEDPESLLLEG